MDHTTIYTNVRFRDKPGKLRLTSEKIAFKPDEGTDGRYDSWKWSAIQKHQVTAKRTKKAQLKLISMEDTSKSVVFTLENHQQLENIRHDVTHRLRKARSNQGPCKRRSTIGQGDFFSDSTVSFSRRGSIMSFATVSDLDMSISGSQQSGLPWDIQLDYSFQTRGLSGLDDSDATATRAINSRHSNLVLDAETDIKPKVRPPATVNIATGAFVKEKAAMKRPVRSRVLSFQCLLLVLLGSAAVVAFSVIGSLGFFNGKVDAASVERLLPFLKVFPGDEKTSLSIFNQKHNPKSSSICLRKRRDETISSGEQCVVAIQFSK
ncbi:expressed unknown protein [Seminavis robusta]|uniref:TFIIH p62 subunit N-terminal domain-containing protein n=1 Tax=Seminavis robusta TaxID=568900 RepID=A0A9N8E6J3_9STRA|nr:expressed unknown protein [Seminavis robusta]|eukprot:Sro596_g172890.1 n/a (320) ;mRNA; f:49483-50442